MTSFKEVLKSRKVSLTSKDFPGGGEQNQKKLAKVIIDSVAEMDINAYVANLIRPDGFEDFMDSCGDLDYHEIYDLAQALKGRKNSLAFFEVKDVDQGKMEIVYPYYDASIGLTKEEAINSLKYLETKYMDGMDADSWYGYRDAMEKALNEKD